jgi:hypothetical protein
LSGFFVEKKIRVKTFGRSDANEFFVLIFSGTAATTKSFSSNLVNKHQTDTIERRKIKTVDRRIRLLAVVNLFQRLERINNIDAVFFAGRNESESRGKILRRAAGNIRRSANDERFHIFEFIAAVRFERVLASSSGAASDLTETTAVA